MRRRTILAGLVAVTGGCSGYGPGAGNSTATDSPAGRTTRSPTDPPTASPASGCDTATETTTPELSVRNERSEPVTVAVTITTDDEQVYAVSLDLRPEGVVDRTDVFPDRGTYTITAETNDDDRHATLDVFPDDERSIVTVRISETIEIGTLQVVPTETATPCP